MTTRKTLTFVLMDPPFESARTTTALRLIDIAVRRGHNVNVFAYEGAVSLAFARQAPHANAVHGRDVAEEDHPLTAGLDRGAARRGARARPQARVDELRPVRGRTRRREAIDGPRAAARPTSRASSRSPTTRSSSRRD